MRYEVIIILLLAVIVGLFSFQYCDQRRTEATSQATYDSLAAEIDTLRWSVALNHIAIDSLSDLVDSLNVKKLIIHQHYAPKLDTIRSASTMQLDSIIRSIIARHDLLHN